MNILGLTGSIGMGKTQAGKMFRDLGVPVFDADEAVHSLLGRGGAAVAEVDAAFPGVVDAGVVDRARLGQRVFADPETLKRLESILHPKVRAARKGFLAQARAARQPLVVLDIPLLFETGGDRQCTHTVVVSAPAFVQRARVMARPGMTEDRFAAVLARQMPDAEKRRRANFVIPTGGSLRQTLNHIRKIANMLGSDA